MDEQVRRERKNARQRAYYLKNREKIYANKKAYRKNHKEIFNAYQRAYYLKRKALKSHEKA